MTAYVDGTLQAWVVKLPKLPLATSQMFAFRAAHGRLQYVAHDRPDLQVAAHVIATGSSHPTTVDEWRLRRAATCLKEFPQLI